MHQKLKKNKTLLLRLSYHVKFLQILRFKQINVNDITYKKSKISKNRNVFYICFAPLLCNFFVINKIYHWIYKNINSICPYCLYEKYTTYYRSKFLYQNSPKEYCAKKYNNIKKIFFQLPIFFSDICMYIRFHV